MVNLSDAPGISSTFQSGILTLNYGLSGVHFVNITPGPANPIVVVLMDKASANKWHAPIIAGSGTFGEFFSVGTNQT